MTGAEREALRVSKEAFNQNFDRLVEFLPDHYVAFIDDRLVLFHDDLGVLVERAYGAFEQRPIFMRRVEPEEEIFIGAMESKTHEEIISKRELIKTA